MSKFANLDKRKFSEVSILDFRKFFLEIQMNKYDQAKLLKIVQECFCDLFYDVKQDRCTTCPIISICDDFTNIINELLTEE